MNDMSSTIIAKSDQINATDLIGTSRTITIKEVRIKAGEDQPVSIMIEGENKAFRPCKGVRRLLVRVWGADASKYIGQSLTIYRDEKVTWAGKEEGGIRVSHMSGLDEKIVEYMRVSRAATKPYEIMPLIAEVKHMADAARKWADGYIAAVSERADLAALNAFANSKAVKLAELESKRPELHRECVEALAARRMELALQDASDDFADDDDETRDETRDADALGGEG